MNSQASMRELVECIAKSLVDDPSQVHVSEIEGENSEIAVAQSQSKATAGSDKEP